MQVETKKVNLSDIEPYWRNPRSNSNAINTVKRSIEEFGYNQYILVDKDLRIIAGHTRYQALKLLDWKECTVLVSDMPEALAKKFRIVDNKTHEHADWDMDKLMAELREIPDAAIGLQPFFQDFSIESFLAGVTAPVHTDGDIAERGKQNDANIASFGKANGNLVTVTCPHCAESFELDKKELARRSNLVDVPKEQQPVQPKNKWGADEEPAKPVKTKGKKK
jgi:hypothetical protein